MDYYKVLGVSNDASADEIAAAFRKKAVQYHPDRNPDDPKAADKFKEVAAAFEILGDPQKRARYDRGGENPTVAGAPFDTDIFSDIFSVFRSHMRHGPSGGRDRGRDARSTVRLTFKEAALGCTKELKIKSETKCPHCERGFKNWEQCPDCKGTGEIVLNTSPWVLKSTCSTCQGGGRVPKEKCSNCHGKGYSGTTEESIPLEIPAGVEDGLQIRIPGKGQPGITGRRGTLFVQIEIEPDTIFGRDGADIICSVPVSYTQLVLGTKITVPTLLGKTDVKIPPGTHPDKRLRLRGLGTPDIHSPGRVGDMFVVLDLDIPKPTDKDYISVIEKLKKAEEKYQSEKMKEFKKVMEEQYGKE